MAHVLAGGRHKRARHIPGRTEAETADPERHPDPGRSRYRAAVTDLPERPLLFLDVDGTLLPTAGAPPAANEVIAPLLGIEPLPVADLPEAPDEDP